MHMIKEIPKEQRPREKLLNSDVKYLSNVELLSILLKCGTKNKSVIDLSKEIINKLTSINNLRECDINFLLNIKGIGKAKACELLASIELGKRMYLLGEKNKKRITSSKDAYYSIKDLLIHKKQEYFYCIYLNNKNEIIERKLLFMGTVNKSIVHPREVFKYAYLYSASSIICVHNHPSNDISPSKEDINLTKSLVEIGKVQCIPILDHIIVGADNYYSMLDNLELFL